MTGRRNVDRRLRNALFLFVILMSLWMVLRSQVAGDQYRLLEPGWLLLSEGELRPYGAPMSGGGVLPGAANSLVAGLPLLVWPDYRAVNLLLFLTHILAYLLLDRLLRDTVSSRERLLFAAPGNTLRRSVARADRRAGTRPRLRGGGPAALLDVRP